ncbi:MAG: hypothetical protein ACPGU7_07370 [Gammaproteobacteria bacterium]
MLTVSRGARDRARQFGLFLALICTLAMTSAPVHAQATYTDPKGARVSYGHTYSQSGTACNGRSLWWGATCSHGGDNQGLCVPNYAGAPICVGPKDNRRELTGWTVWLNDPAVRAANHGQPASNCAQACQLIKATVNKPWWVLVSDANGGRCTCAAEQANPNPPYDPLANAPICGRGLSCSNSGTTGAAYCKKTANATQPSWCCPPGFRASGGQCTNQGVVNAPLCGAGLSCSSSGIPHATYCKMTPHATSPSWCCPPGQRVSGGQCTTSGVINAPVCPSGRACANSGVTGAMYCKATATSTSAKWCCPSGQRIVSGQCRW